MKTTRRGRIILAALVTTIILVMVTISTENQYGIIKHHHHNNIGSIDKIPKQQCSNFNSSIAMIWNNLEDKILKASYFPEKHASNAKFTHWVDTLFWSEYQLHQLRRSTFHPPDPATMLRLLQIIDDRVEFLKHEQQSAVDASSYAPPLHIMVLGGSVTVGMGCSENQMGVQVGSSIWNVKHLHCAWPSRLEHLFNQVLFEGKEVVKVSNLASGGASTEVGKVVLEYQLFTEEMKKSLPHVVIWAHAPNDSQEADKGAVEYIHLPGFVRAAFNLRMCDNDLPLVVMLDDFYGAGEYTTVNDISTMLFKISSWYNLMGVSHSNVVKHKLYAHFGNPSTVTDILGSGWNLHAGMGNHIGIAWAVFFNFLKAFAEGCEDGPDLDKNTDTSLYTKNLGSYIKHEDVKTLQSRWQNDTDRTREICLHEDGLNKDVCAYAWMVNTMTRIYRPNHVDAKMKEVMESNDGWKASGDPIKQPRTGWYAQKENAMFSLQLVPSIETRYITIMSMKSYGNNFRDTRLQLQIDVRQLNGAQAESVHEITGYHETKTSIHVPHKFELPGGGANIGDTIHVKVELVSGSYFKINGISLCTY